MGKVIEFPSGTTIALYTQGFVYSGTLENKENIVSRSGIWLTNASIYPIASQVTPSQVLQLDSVCVFWDEVVAFSPSPLLHKESVE